MLGIAGTAALFGLVLVPIAAANPGYSEPDPQPVVSGATLYNNAVNTSWTNFQTAVSTNAQGAVDQLMALKMPLSELTNISKAMETLGVGVTGATQAFVVLLIQQSSSVSAQKIQETGDIAVASIDYARTTVDSAGVVVKAAYDAVCTQPGLAPPPVCNQGSIIDESFKAIDAIAAEIQEQINKLDAANAVVCMAHSLADALLVNGGDSIPVECEA